MFTRTPSSYQPPFRPSRLPSVLPSSSLPSPPFPPPPLTAILPSRHPLVFHAGTGPQPAGFLARRSSSSAFCFHQWTAALHFCCVSKYLLAFLFLADSQLMSGVFLSTACACARARASHRMARGDMYTTSAAALRPVLSQFSNIPLKFPNTRTVLPFRPFPSSSLCRERKHERKSLLLLPPDRDQSSRAGGRVRVGGWGGNPGE